MIGSNNVIILSFLFIYAIHHAVIECLKIREIQPLNLTVTSLLSYHKKTTSHLLSRGG